MKHWAKVLSLYVVLVAIFLVLSSLFGTGEQGALLAAVAFLLLNHCEEVFRRIG